MPLKYAEKLEDIMQALGPKQLQIDELDRFFQETEEARDPRRPRRETIYNLLRTDENVKVVVLGHGGTGKSTELVKFQQEHAQEFAFLSTSPVEEMIMSSLSTEALLILVIETMVRGTKEKYGVELSETVLKLIYQWFQEAITINERDLAFVAEAGVGADTKDT